MEGENIFSDLYKELDEVSTFFRFNRKEKAGSIKIKLESCEKKIQLIPKIEQSLSELGAKNSGLIREHHALNVEHSLLSQQHETLGSTHKEVTTKYDLVSNILSAKNNDNEAMHAFDSFVENDFLEFANQENSLAEEAKAVLMLQNVQRELLMISSFPGIYNKNIVAVGGGFSSGKSEFISSFFLDKTIKLPIGIKPVTAIPTYISNGDNHLIKGYSYKGGSVNISPELYAELSHDFIKSFSFNLKDIVPMMAIETEIKNYNDICFIDTPGYNPSNTGTTGGDHQTAVEYLENANVLLWVIGLDASDGAVPASDIEFLEDLMLVADKRLFVVANKADLKSPSELEEILDNFEDMLEEANISYCGISAYNSIGKKELSFRKKSLLFFLQEIDSPISAKEKITSELDKVFNMYNEAISEQLKWTKNIQSDLKSLELDFMQDGMDIYESDRASNRLEKIRQAFGTDSLKKQLGQLESLRSTMLLLVNGVFKSL